MYPGSYFIPVFEKLWYIPLVTWLYSFKYLFLSASFSLMYCFWCKTGRWNIDDETHRLCIALIKFGVPVSHFCYNALPSIAFRPVSSALSTPYRFLSKCWCALLIAMLVGKILEDKEAITEFHQWYVKHVSELDPMARKIVKAINLYISSLSSRVLAHCHSFFVPSSSNC
jgi:hypothetical protein